MSDLYPVLQDEFFIRTIKAGHSISIIKQADGQQFTRIEDNEGKLFLAWADSAKLEYVGKIQMKKQPEFLRHPQNFADFSIKLSITYT